jgi:hypothetical protein
MTDFPINDIAFNDDAYENHLAAPSSLKNQNGPSEITFTPSDFGYDEKRIFVNVWFWPGVRFVYAPGYVVWRSPWRWGLYPKWWRPWRPIGYRAFYGRCATHRLLFHRVPTRGVVLANRLYAPRRNHSTLVVHKRRSTVIIKSRPGGRVKAVKIKRGRGRRP